MAGSSKDAKRSKNEFPDTLEEFGYHFNKDGAMCDIKTGSPFQFVVKEGNQSYNQKHYEALGEVVTNHVYGLLESECGLKRVPVPKDNSNKEHSSFMFMSKDALSNPDKLLVLIHGSGVVRAGQWARRLIINESLKSGTQIPFIHRAMKEGYGVIVMNTNDNVRKTDNGEVRLKGSESPEVHGSSVWVDYIQQSAARHIAVIAHSFGGVVTTSLFAKFKTDFKNRVFAVAMTDSVHYISHPNAFRVLIKLSRNWATSSKLLDTPLQTRDGDIARFSAGVGVHEQTSWSSFESIFKFFNDKLEQIKGRSDEECQDEPEQTKDHREQECQDMEELQCAVCSEDYEPSTREPVMLPSCGHTFCRPCLANLESNGPLDCPSCRKRHAWPMVHELPANFIALSLIDSKKTKVVSESDNSETCQWHRDQLGLWCQDCQQTMCGVCFFETHQGKGHTVLKVQNIIHEKKQQVNISGSLLIKQVNQRKEGVLDRVHESVVKLVRLCEESLSLNEYILETEDIMKEIEGPVSLQVIMSSAQHLDKLMDEFQDDFYNNSEPKEEIEISENQASSLAPSSSENGNQNNDILGAVGGDAEGEMRVDAPSWMSRNQIWPLTCCAVSADGRAAQLRYEDNKLHLYCLSHDHQDPRFAIQMGLVRSMMSAADPLVFLDLSTTGRHLGRVYIRLWGHLRRAQQFLALCLGTLGPSYFNAKFAKVDCRGQPGECVRCGEYVTKDGERSSQGLMEGLEWGGPFQKPQQEGQVVGSGGGRQEMGAYFDICTKSKPGQKFSCPFGEVVIGLNIVRMAVAHEPISEVILSNVGVVIPPP